MTNTDPISQKVKDLLFEIEGGPEAKFLLCVCDDRADRRRARRRLIEALCSRGKKVTSISAKNATGRLLAAYTALAQGSKADCINLWGIPSMRSSAADQIFEELNFHRDTLASFGVPLLVWLTSAQLQRLASIAPDFWSRRTAVYLFDKPSAKNLLQRLFASNKSTARKRPSEIERSFDEILVSEKDLSRCIKREENFSLEAADEQIKKLESNLDYLIRQCSQGRQLDVTLWLWSATQIERDLRFFVNRLQPEERNIYAYVYTDRTEVILALAEEMPRILSEYAGSIKEKVRQGRRANLVKFFRNIAFARLNEVLRDIETEEVRSVHTLPVLPDDVLKDDDLASYERPEEEDASSQAVYDLESWLSGYSSNEPKYFSPEEVLMLKVLYSESSDPRDVAKIADLSIRETKKRIARLEEKVRLYLSGEWLISPKVLDPPSISHNHGKAATRKGG
jgi:hypothetical protein